LQATTPSAAHDRHRVLRPGRRFLLLARFLPGVKFERWSSAVSVAVVFSVLNFLVGWAIGLVVGVALFLPMLLTFFVLMPFLVNAILLWLTDQLVDTFELRDMRSLLIAAGAITAVNAACFTCL
jgi:putative membrane protein